MRFFQATIEKEDVDPKCSVCGKVVGSAGHVASGCTGLVQREYRRKHDWMRLRVYWELCQKYGVNCADVLCKVVPNQLRVLEVENVKIWWGWEC